MLTVVFSGVVYVIPATLPTIQILPVLTVSIINKFKSVLVIKLGL